MTKVLPSYKQLCKRIHRLPLDAYSLNNLIKFAKSYYMNTNKPYFDNKLYNKQITLLDDILINENWNRIEELLDVIYKDAAIVPSWIKTFQHISYLSWKREWPQVHLIYELTSNVKVIKRYENSINDEKNDHISLVNYFNIDSESIDKDLRPLKRTGCQSSNEDVLKQIVKLHEFLFKNQSKLTHLKILPLEVIYPTNRFSLPLHITKRDRLLKQKIAYIKNLYNQFRPIQKESLEHLINFSIYRPGLNANSNYEINNNFFKYMIKKHEDESDKLNPLVRKYLRPKTLIPNDNNIRKIFREYVRKQYYVLNDEYKLSWMQNFYENNHQITDYKLNII